MAQKYRANLDATEAPMIGWLRRLVDPEGVVELRALHVDTGYRTCTMSGFFDFDHLDEMVRHALELTGKARGVYFTLNPLHRDLLARRANRVGKAETGDAAADPHVLRRRWLLVDLDPVRVSGISSTDAEKAHAFDVARALRTGLYDFGWPEPVLADSGNGYHLLFRLDLPTNDGGLVEQTLKSLANQFDSDKVKLDTSVFNPARICRLYGTTARKGDPMPDRPHRQSAILEGLADA